MPSLLIHIFPTFVSEKTHIRVKCYMLVKVPSLVGMIREGFYPTNIILSLHS